MVPLASQGLPLVPDDLRAVAAGSAASTVVISNSSRHATASACYCALASDLHRLLQCTRVPWQPPKLRVASVQRNSASAARASACNRHFTRHQGQALNRVER